MLRTMVLKPLKRTIKKREFWFAILFYPAIMVGYFYLKNNVSLKSYIEKNNIAYFIITFAISIYIICYVLVEVIGKKLLHQVQGDKLKIKEKKWR